jgi:outer membrane protein OmpA-like peptidoglycan-associated protein
MPAPSILFIAASALLAAQPPLPPLGPIVEPCPNGRLPPPGEICRSPGPYLVFFDWGSAAITPATASILDAVVEGRRVEQAGARVVLSGSADRSGSDEFNVALSRRRAESVRLYLLARGIEADAFEIRAFGETRPLVDTPDGAAEPQNRYLGIEFGPSSDW